MLLLPQITTVEIGLDVLGGSDLLAWRQDMQLASAAPGGAAAATTTQAKPPPTHDTRIVLALTLFLNLNLTLIRLSDRTLIRSLTIILTLATQGEPPPTLLIINPGNTAFETTPPGKHEVSKYVQEVI
jgi:hypothetical protein